ncbi:HTH-type transcriptional regulatory protein GabR [Candidatus Izimaplasma bacterium HR1]|jgi:GntR family transcriptional regulator/MocR family aminotransferase|uniref:MocR-like pyridoxine biosynthesis transcription factor PdxR n=1 Tax=Candidatus Izimoplasma sp. HR1 TaxID=1541959 RepID=UPI0004F82E90|nr:HTH-type transcriptional regulatory protein GabR [Candidatus Izimaplasma bacterium HR1]
MSKMNIPLYQSLYEDIKDKIIRNDYKKNSKLESVRSLAKRLDISTTTVEKAYNQLMVEGYIKSIPRSGYIVMDVHILEKERYRKYIEPIDYRKSENNKLTEDLFDMKPYKATVNKVFNYQSEKLYETLDPRGEYELREEIRKYILKERNVKCDINQIIVGPGIQSLLNILLSITNKKTVTYLSPEFPKAMNIFRGYGYSLKPRKSTIEIARLKADFLYISPSNTYPTGEVLKAQERNKIIKWAHENKSYIIEDDYNFFFRYNSYSIPAIYSYDDGRSVIYVGSFSKTIIPSIRVSYMVLPLDLYNIYKGRFMDFSQGVSKLEQLSLAQYMKDGLFQRHIKKLFNLYKEKNAVMINALTKNNKKKQFKVRGTESNLHVVLDFKGKSSKGVFTRNCDRYYLKYEEIKKTNSVIFPYSGFTNKEIPKLVKNLFYNM